MKLHLPLLAAVLVAAAAHGADADRPQLASRSAVLLDATTGTVLFEKDADLVIPPASLTKLMTIHIALEDVAAGRASLDEAVPVGRESWAASQPWGSSLMFLAPGQRVTLRELILGLAVASGNDAAVAVAMRLSGSVPAFAGRMNAEAAALGLRRTRFVEPSGISEFNETTAGEFAAFCREYLFRHPEALGDYHSVKEFAYPKPENLPEAFRGDPRTIIQYNRNVLLNEVEGVDGLKTGFIIESGYNLALTAERGGTRLLAVLLGGPGSSSVQGGRIRADDGGKLLDWGFERFRTIKPSVASLDPARVWKGSKKLAALVPGDRLEFTAPADRARAVTYEVTRYPGILAPVRRGAELGELVFSDERGVLKWVPLVAAEEVPLGNPLRRLADTLALFFLRLFGGQRA
jgi:D-alanyl-D-alanine carboxypeptidase (penicillin-binding protein 5/6)